MKVREITPPADTDTLLAGAQFADAFQIGIGDRELDARRAAERRAMPATNTILLELKPSW